MSHKPVLATRTLARAAFAAAWLATCLHAAAQVPADPYNYSRSSSFTYQSNGLLATETVEPDNANLCVTTTYHYDAYGNKDSATTANCANATGRAVFTSRASGSTYGAQTVTIGTIAVAIPAGAFATVATNALSQSETRKFDPRFGAAISLTGPNQLTTTVQVDDFGRPVQETRADGTSTRTMHCIVSGQGIVDLSSNSSGCGTAGWLSGQSSELPSGAVTFVQTQAFDASGQAMGPAARVYKDKEGRTVRELAEAFDAGNQPTTRRVIAKDTQYSLYGVAILSTAPYFLGADSSTVAGSGDMGMTLTTVDALGRPTQIDVADPAGAVSGVNFNGRGTRTSARTTIAYSGLDTTTTNPAGQTRFEEKNADGRVVRIKDTYGAQLVHQHDAFGNLVATKDALQNLILLNYDIRGRKLGMNDPDTGLWEYDYDALGQLVWQRNPNQRNAGTATTMAYDKLGRMGSRTEPEYTSTWTYDLRADGSACMANVPGSSSTPGVGKLCESNTSHGVNKKYAYDSLGRPASARTTVSSGPSFATSVSYQTSTGRLLSQTYPTGMQVQYSYSSRGFMTALTLGTALTISPLPANPGGTPVGGASWPMGTALWTAGTVNAWGKAETQTLNNNIATRAGFDANTGRVLSLQGGIGTATNVLNQAYTWDSLNNLKTRSDANGDGSTGAVSETFAYDSLNRLTHYDVNAPLIPGLTRGVDLYYNAIGNLLYKSDVGNYSYPAYGNVAGVSNPRPHAVSIVTGTSFGTVNYGYDANGNATTADGQKWRSIAYTSFNLPDGNTGMAGVSGSPRYTWQYDENHQRIKETRSNSSGTRTTWFQHPDNQGGLAFESETAPSGAVSNRHYLSAGGQSIVVVSTGALPVLSAGQMAPVVLGTLAVVKVEFWHKDHLGSLVATTDHLGNVTARYAYDPFGKRRMTNGSYDAFGTLVVDWTTDTNSGTDRGYTGHEHLDDLGVVHMNGRVFDPTIGRFLQGDPFIQAMGEMQNYNRYSYCYGNPLNCTDPSGYFSLGKFLRVAGAVAIAIYAPELIQNFMISSAAGGTTAFATMSGGTFLSNAAIVTGFGQATSVAVAGFLSGAISTGSFGGGLQGAFSATIFAGVGDFLNAQGAFSGGTDYGEWSTMGVTAHAVAGCITSVEAGAKCGAGAISAAFSQAALPLKQVGGGNPFAGVTISMIIGGTASKLGGGSFANGAQTAAMGYLFNCVNHPGRCKPEDRDAIRNAFNACNGNQSCESSYHNDARQAGMPGVPMISLSAVLGDLSELVAMNTLMAGAPGVLLGEIGGQTLAIGKISGGLEEFATGYGFKSFSGPVATALFEARVGVLVNYLVVYYSAALNWRFVTNAVSWDMRAQGMFATELKWLKEFGRTDVKVLPPPR